MTLVLVAVAVGACAFGAAAAALAEPRRSWVERRLEPHVGPLRQPASARSRRTRGRTLSGSWDRVVRRSPVLRAQTVQLERAGVKWPAPRVLGLGVAVPLAVVALLAAAGRPLGLAVAFALGIAVVPHASLRVRAARRARTFDEQLPDVLDLLAGSLKVGHGFEQALAAVTADAAEPTRSEFRRALGEIRLGRDPGEALADVGRRLSSRDLPFVLTAVELHHQVGGSLADLLALVASAVRDRQQFRRKLRGLTGTGRMSAAVLVALPFVAAAGLTALRPEYMAPLWHTSTGRLLVALALGMMIVGAALLKRIVSIRG